MASPPSGRQWRPVLRARQARRAPLLQQQAGAIATALSGARRPLVISGTGCGSAAILRAAAAVAGALCNSGRQAMLCLCVPEANSLGQAMLAGPGAPDLATLQRRATAGEIDTLMVLENDLYRRGSSAQIDALLAACPEVIVLDGLDNATTSAATLALPAANFAESEGTLVSLEGRAQRYYPVFQPRAERRPSWVWLLACMKELELPEVQALHHFDDITRGLRRRHPRPGRDYRGGAGPPLPQSRGEDSPPTHRYSGRTAMRANISVHEPKQREDEESPLAFTMEGLNRAQPGALLPWVWAPGWNSNQSLHKFQTDAGGPLKGGTAGVRLLPPGRGGAGTTAAATPATTPAPGAPPSRTGTLAAGTAPAHIRQRRTQRPEPGHCRAGGAGLYRTVRRRCGALGVTAGDGVEVGEGLATLEVQINDRMAAGCAGYGAGLDDTGNLAALGAWSPCAGPRAGSGGRR